MKFWDFCLFMIGLCLIGWGGITALGGTLQFLNPDHEMSLITYLVQLFILGVLPMGAGGWLSYYAVNESKGSEKAESERLVLLLAEERGGKLSAAEVAAHSRLTSEEASRILESLHGNSICEMQVSEGGGIFYNFPGLDEARKPNAAGFVDDGSR
ncbi:MAG: hypothetical protein QNK37_21065 [Acidobacteriota bacterium]|nr:hypothetical protein [Acidobacteriota bacterium]